MTTSFNGPDTDETHRAAGEPEGTPVLTSARRRLTRPSRLQTIVAAGAVAAVAGASGVTAALHTTPAADPSPLAAVTGALARTSAESYTFSLDSSVRLGEKELSSDEVSGSFGPGRRLGTEQLIARSAGRTSRAQIRFIGAYLYTSVVPGSGFSKLWDKSPLAAVAGSAMPPGDLYGFVSDHPVSPDGLNAVLRSAGASIRDSGAVSGPGWKGTKYTFTAPLYGGRQSVIGTVYVDQQGRVRRLTTLTTVTRERSIQKTFVTTYRDITFADFGAVLQVTAPPASQTKYTTGEPYWGFYF